MNTENELAVAIRPNMQVGQALGVDEILAQVSLIQNVMHRVMQEGEHYGTIPGCGEKKTLLQPGAQKLTMTFRLAPEYELQETDLPRGHKEYRVICTLKSIQSGMFVGQGVGCCSTMESKYRWHGGSRKCPHCGKEAIIKGKAEYGGGWLCFAKKGGCGAKWPDGATEIESQSVEKVENDNPADHFNTVLKMAKKRAFVDATITATAASDIFTQDIGDTEEDAPPEPPKSKQTPLGQPATPNKPTVSNDEQAKADHAAMLALLRKRVGRLEPEVVRFLRANQSKSGAWYLMPNENLEDLTLEHITPLVNHWDEVYPKIEDWLRLHDTHPELEPEGMEQNPETGQFEIEPANEGWRLLLVPFGKDKGVRFGALEKGQLWWWCTQWKPEPFTSPKNGKTYPPKESDLELRKILDGVRDHYKFTDKKQS